MRKINNRFCYVLKVWETLKVSQTSLVYTPSVFLLLLLFVQCQEAKKGCLDIRATNFDVTADEPCTDNCCTYPTLLTETTYTADTSIFRFENKYKIGNDSVKILECQFYLSDFQLVTADNKTATTIDSVALNRQTDTIKTLNNYALVGRKNGFSFNIGTFNTIDKFIKLRFKVGLSDAASKTVPTKMPSSHPLSIQSDSMYITASKTYIYNRIVIAKGQNFKDTLRLYITTPRDIEITKNITSKEGFDVAIPLTINYLAFLKDVNFAGTENSIKEKIVSNYDKVFQ